MMIDIVPAYVILDTRRKTIFYYLYYFVLFVLLLSRPNSGIFILYVTVRAIVSSCTSLTTTTTRGVFETRYFEHWGTARTNRVGLENLFIGLNMSRSVLWFGWLPVAYTTC